uniref:Uncharacterized protein n=1 Tax=Zea mays TaxID=4577 RepID=A0A804UDK0_MAIZE
PTPASHKVQPRCYRNAEKCLTLPESATCAVAATATASTSRTGRFIGLVAGFSGKVRSGQLCRRRNIEERKEVGGNGGCDGGGREERAGARQLRAGARGAGPAHGPQRRGQGGGQGQAGARGHGGADQAGDRRHEDGVPPQHRGAARGDGHPLQDLPRARARPRRGALLPHRARGAGPGGRGALLLPAARRRGRLLPRPRGVPPRPEAREPAPRRACHSTRTTSWSCTGRCSAASSSARRGSQRTPGSSSASCSTPTRARASPSLASSRRRGTGSRCPSCRRSTSRSQPRTRAAPPLTRKSPRAVAAA